MQQLRPAEVVRNAHGYWTHPDLPDFQGDPDNFREWKAAQQLEQRSVWLEAEAVDHPVCVSYFHKGDPDVTDWEPPVPDGDGWFLIGLWDTEDGPVAWFARVPT